MGSVLRMFRQCFHSDKNHQRKPDSAIALAETQHAVLSEPNGCEPPAPAQIQAADRPAGVSVPGPTYATVQSSQALGQTIPASSSQAQLAYAGGNAESLATNPIFLRALFSFERQTADDLSFKKGDRLFLIRQCATLDFNCKPFLV